MTIMLCFLSGILCGFFIRNFHVRLRDVEDEVIRISLEQRGYAFGNNHEDEEDRQDWWWNGGEKPNVGEPA